MSSALFMNRELKCHGGASVIPQSQFTMYLGTEKARQSTCESWHPIVVFLIVQKTKKASIYDIKYFMAALALKIRNVHFR